MALIRRDDKLLAASFTAEALALKEAALASGALVGKVTNGEEQEAAVTAQKEVGRILKLAEDARKAAKEPVLEYGRRIDDAAKRFIEDLKVEQLRLAKLVADFQQLEQARVRAAQLAREAEERKLQEERRRAEEEVQRKAREEQQRLDEESRKAAALAQSARDNKEREAAAALQLEIDRQKALASAQSHDALDRINDQHSAAVADLPTASAVRTEGQRVTESWEFEVTDIWTLARAHPACVVIAPRRSEIKSLLNAGAKVAGIRAWKETKASVNVRPMAKAIDV